MIDFCKFQQSASHYETVHSVAVCAPLWPVLGCRLAWAKALDFTINNRTSF